MWRMRKKDNRIGALGETKGWLWALGKCVAVGIGRAESLCTVIYNPKRISLGMILYYGQICPCRAQASVHSSLYSHYKHLVLALQAPCTGTTSILYRRYKHLVLALQSILYWRYKHLVVSVQNVFRCTANVVVLIHCWQSRVGEQLSKINPF